MCQYRYYFYGECRHQETVLFNYCENARPRPSTKLVPLADRICHHVGEEDASDGYNTSTNRGRDNGKGEGPLREPNGTRHLPTSTSFSLSEPAARNHTSSSTLDQGSASITTEPGPSLNPSSLPQHCSHSSPSSVPTITPTAHNMDGLPLLGSTIRYWMPGTTMNKASDNQPDKTLKAQVRDTLEYDLCCFDAHGCCSLPPPLYVHHQKPSRSDSPGYVRTRMKAAIFTAGEEANDRYRSLMCSP